LFVNHGYDLLTTVTSSRFGLKNVPSCSEISISYLRANKEEEEEEETERERERERERKSGFVTEISSELTRTSLLYDSLLSFLPLSEQFDGYSEDCSDLTFSSLSTSSSMAYSQIS